VAWFCAHFSDVTSPRVYARSHFDAQGVVRFGPCTTPHAPYYGRARNGGVMLASFRFHATSEKHGEGKWAERQLLRFSTIVRDFSMLRQAVGAHLGGPLLLAHRSLSVSTAARGFNFFCSLF